MNFVDAVSTIVTSILTIRMTYCFTRVPPLLRDVK
jgi:hypothetical protein